MRTFCVCIDYQVSGRLEPEHCAHTLCRENQFLLEERDLLSQQLAAENLRESTTTPLQGNRGGVPTRVLSPIPYFTPATPSATGSTYSARPTLAHAAGSPSLGSKHAACNAAFAEVRYIYNWRSFSTHSMWRHRG